ncbi:hypothetical protein [Sphingobacterium sp.]|uniref:hypothetical protein n=1 Tax=Sphingobacterium sp. TaxID=341027 RepID=UPI0031D7C305
MESKEYLIELLKEKYHYELSRRDKFEDNLSLPVTVLGLIIAGLFYVINEVYSDTLSSCSKAIFIGMIGLMLIIIIGAILSLVYVFFGFKREYCTFPESKAILERYEEIKVYSEKHKEDDSFITSSLKKDTIKWYSDCNENNTRTNDRRANAFHTFKMLFSIIIILGVLLMFLVFYLKVN